MEDDDDFNDLLEDDMIECQMNFEKMVEKVKELYKPVTTFVIVAGSRNFQSVSAAVSVKFGCVPIFLSPVNYQSFESHQFLERPEIFIRRSLHYLRYHHSDKIIRLEQISEDKAINCDDL